MANTTFSGPVRSENGFKMVNKATTSGLVTDISTINTSTRDNRRYYLSEYWKQRPALNADIDKHILLKWHELQTGTLKYWVPI